MARLHILIAISEDGELNFWSGKEWLNWEDDKARFLPVWKDGQVEREANVSMRFLPSNITRDAVFWPRVKRPGEE